jgi:hypothetical protein
LRGFARQAAHLGLRVRGGGQRIPQAPLGSLDAASQRLLLLSGQKPDPADLAEVDPKDVISDGDRLRGCLFDLWFLRASES